MIEKMTGKARASFYLEVWYYGAWVHAPQWERLASYQHDDRRGTVLIRTRAAYGDGYYGNRGR